MNRFQLQINENDCWGCRTCEIACKQEHDVPVGIRFISVSENGAELNGNRRDFHFLISVCRHCDDPPCVEACQERAMVQRKDGIVVLDSDRCNGCGSCSGSCPHDAIHFDAKNGIAQKCNLCHDRVDNGLIPACADNICLAHCINFTY